MASKMLTWIRILTTNQTKQKQLTQNQTNPNHQKMDEMDHPQKKLSHLQVGITKKRVRFNCREIQDEPQEMKLQMKIRSL